MDNLKSMAYVSTDIKKKSVKKYKCPYCDMRFERTKLHIHIQNKHEDMIPEGYTALRVAFNSINHKTEGHCIICKGVTDWDESKGRYNRLCNNPACKEAYKKLCASRNQQIYGTDRLQTDPRYADIVQRKALEGRKIAGKYKFKDGGVITFLGSYEKKFLEFVDQVMNCKSEDIMSPGPTIKYMFNNEEHIYLPDFFYVPYNLLIEIKDGGSNPNNHPHRTGMDQEKLIAKEKAISEQDQYNYVRVVNNDFSQLLGIMSVIKYNMQENIPGRVMRVNETVELYDWKWLEKFIYESATNVHEDMSGTIGAALAPTPIPYECDKNNYYIIQHPKNNKFAYGITKDPVQNIIYSVDPTEKGFYKVFKTDKSKIDKRYTTFKIKDSQSAKELYDELALIAHTSGKIHEDGIDALTYAYRTLTDEKKIPSPDQIFFDSRFELVQNPIDAINKICNSLYKYLKAEPITQLEEQVNDLEEFVNKHGVAFFNEDLNMSNIESIDISHWDYKLCRAKEAESQGLIIMVADVKDYYHMYDEDVIAELKKKYERYQSLPSDKRVQSNLTASNIFGVDNEVLYTRILNTYLNKLDSNVLEHQDGSPAKNEPLNLLNITKNDSEGLNNSACETYSSMHYIKENYNLNKTLAIKSIEYRNARDPKKKSIIENEIINMGWYPEVPFNEEAFEKKKMIDSKMRNLNESAEINEVDKIFEIANILLNQ